MSSRANKYTPRRLGEKLAEIRMKLGVETYEGMIARLNIEVVPLYRACVYKYEQGLREPPLIVLLRYARIANVPLEMIIDDSLDLPTVLPKGEKPRILS